MLPVETIAVVVAFLAKSKNIVRKVRMLFLG